jgi:hypothetical protein
MFNYKFVGNEQHPANKVKESEKVKKSFNESFDISRKVNSINLMKQKTLLTSEEIFHLHGATK